MPLAGIRRKLVALRNTLTLAKIIGSEIIVAKLPAKVEINGKAYTKASVKTYLDLAVYLSKELKVNVVSKTKIYDPELRTFVAKYRINAEEAEKVLRKLEKTVTVKKENEKKTAKTVNIEEVKAKIIEDIIKNPANYMYIIEKLLEAKGEKYEIKINEKEVVVKGKVREVVKEIIEDYYSLNRFVKAVESGKVPVIVLLPYTFTDYIVLYEEIAKIVAMRNIRTDLFHITCPKRIIKRTLLQEVTVLKLGEQYC